MEIGRFARLGGVCVALTLAATASGAAEVPAKTCELQMLADIEMSTELDGEVAVPSQIEGQDGLLLVDTGGVQSVIGDSFGGRLNLTQTSRGGSFVLFGGVHLDAQTRVKTFRVGTLIAHDFPMLVAPSKILHDDTVGMLAPDVLSNYDVEFDFAAGHFRLFEPERCKGQVVYWTKQPYAVVPMSLDNDNHIKITLVLDGKEMTADIDTGADRSTMSMADFTEIFGRKRDDPALKTVEEHASINGTRAAAIYRFPFQTMTFEGVQVSQPDIDILEGARFDPGESQIILGIETLRQLHMYIGYEEGRLYLTPAEAR